MFSGSTQVNATDLRRLRFPELRESHHSTLFDARDSCLTDRGVREDEPLS